MAINPVQMQKFLGGLDYPCSKNELIAYAEEHGADEKALQTLHKLPRKTFNKPTDVSRAVGKE